MDTIDVAIPKSLYVSERVNSVRRLRSMLLKYELKSKSYPELHVSTEMKIALSWYVHLNINFLRFTDAQVRKYFSMLFKKDREILLLNNLTLTTTHLYQTL